MLDKASGRVAYAVIKTGGLLGTHHHYPVQWGALKYDPKRQAFQTELTLNVSTTAPASWMTTPSTGVTVRNPTSTRNIGRSDGLICPSAATEWLLPRHVCCMPDTSREHLASAAGRPCPRRFLATPLLK